ncbi:MAG: GGDEF domain-containing protein [Eubacterium sp.]|nr:GGDEF domain-containing protein [Eubacterium sp.]
MRIAISLPDILYLEINLFGAAIMLILILKLIKSSRVKGQMAFSRLLAWQMVLFFSDALSKVSQDYKPDFLDAILLLSKSFYFIAIVAITCECFVYFEYCRNSALSRKKRFMIWMRISVWFYAALTVLNIRFGFLFYVDQHGKYNRGDFFPLPFLLCTIYSVVSMIRSITDAFKMDNYADRGYFLSLGLFPVIPMVAGYIQYYFPDIPLLCPVLSTFSILIYINAMEQVIFMDPLTGLNNRRCFIHGLVSMMKNSSGSEKLYFAMIDLNHFKSINDTYGHNTGDSALLLMADAMMTCTDHMGSHSILCRYGGDEFAVLLASADENEMNRYLEKVEDRIRILTKERCLPCEITFSAGISIWDGSEEPDSFIERADREMYRVKARTGNCR